MNSESTLIEDLKTVNSISRILNQALDSQSALDTSLQYLVQLMNLDTGWIFVNFPGATERWAGRGYILAAHHKLPPALALDNQDAWEKGCNCQSDCNKGLLVNAYNEVSCSRLAESYGDRHNLAVHASAPLKAGDRVLGILNVAARDFSSFDERSLALLATVGDLIGVALERAQLHDLLRERRIQEQGTLLELSRKLLSSFAISDLDTFIVQEVRRLLDVAACSLFMPVNDRLAVTAAAGWRTNPLDNASLVTVDPGSPIAQVFGSQKPYRAILAKQGYDVSGFAAATGEDFLSLAAVPLVIEELSVGVLAVHSRDEREFSTDDLRLLSLMANQAAIVIESVRLRQEELERQRFDQELQVGREIQLSMLPHACPNIPGWDFAFQYLAAREIGGDFFDFIPLRGEDDRLGIVIADVAGKGVPAAMFMALSRTNIRSAALPNRSPAAAFQLANRFIIDDSQADMFLTAFYGQLETSHGRMVYVNAGHNYPILFRMATGQCEELTNHGLLLGIFDNLEFDEYETIICPGDTMILYTDGITDAINENLQEFGVQHLVELVAKIASKNPGVTAEEIMEEIWGAVNEHTGSTPQYDDMALLVIKRTGDSFVG